MAHRNVNPTASEEFLSVCLPDIMKRYQFDAMKCLLNKNSKGVEKLRRLALLVMVENALENPEKQETLREMISESK